VKLTNPETIQESEKEFIDTINAELDWNTIEKLLLEKHQFAIQDEVDFKEGNLIVHNNQIVYKFNFEIKVPLSVIFNRQGECLKISTVRDDGDGEDEDTLSSDKNDEPHVTEDAPTKTLNSDKVGQMASDIADMISEINRGDE